MKTYADIKPAPPELIKALFDLAPEDPGKGEGQRSRKAEKSDSRGSSEVDFGPLDVEKYLSAHGYTYRAKKKGSKTIYVLEHCLFDPSHVGQDAGIVQDTDGTLRYQCFHDSCRGRTWFDARALISGDKSLAEFCRNYDPSKLHKKKSRTRPKEPPSPLAGGSAPAALPAPDKCDPSMFRKDGKFNPTYLVKYLAEYLRPIVFDGAEFYHYKQHVGVWRPVDVEGIAKVAYVAMGETATSSKIQDAIRMLGYSTFVTAEDFRHDASYLNVKNGMIDYVMGKVFEHHPDYYSRIQLPVEYNQDATAPRWQQFLKEIFPDDAEKARALQAYFGYCLLPDCRHQRCLFLLGSGANGKSVVIDVLVSILGADNVCSLPLQLMGERFLIGQLKDKLVNVASELATNRPVDTANFKDAVTGGLLMADQKHGKPFAFYPIAKHIFSMNEVPKITDKSYGFQRRPIVLMFNERFEGDRRDPDLTQKLIQERDGIFNWMMDGLYLVLEKGDLYVPDVVEKDTSIMVKSTNPVLLFVDECCELDPEYFVKTTALYDSYKDWCEDGHNRPLSRNRFYDQLMIHFPLVRKDRSRETDSRIHIFRGIGLQYGV